MLRAAIDPFSGAGGVIAEPFVADLHWNGRRRMFRRDGDLPALSGIGFGFVCCPALDEETGFDGHLRHRADVTEVPHLGR